MQIYESKCGLLPGSSYSEVIREARKQYHRIQKRTPRRQAYVKSKYFKRDKVFINQFWEHLKQKHPGDRLRRAKLFVCAIDLIRNNTVDSDSISSQADTRIVLHRFYGKIDRGLYFCVQIRENKRTGRKDFMSVFPIQVRDK